MGFPTYKEAQSIRYNLYATKSDKAINNENNNCDNNNNNNDSPTSILPKGALNYKEHIFGINTPTVISSSTSSVQNHLDPKKLTLKA
ncbi:hypothetical protein F8M41_012287 [Gigaspora margarita]|uniref:Uncharacterized protein n=1 Tax=Gigaspora margarita TaxID=4874 RepID=A0A8H4B3W6_GIGMA|nr:hypothetical protein F8M41_012287 [Gigaspora margarita]